MGPGRAVAIRAGNIDASAGHDSQDTFRPVNPCFPSREIVWDCRLVLHDGPDASVDEAKRRDRRVFELF